MWWGRPVEVPAETLAEQIEGERVDTRGGEAEDSGHQGDDQVGQGQIRQVVVEGAVHVEHVVGEPAQGEQAHEHQHNLSQALPGLHLRGGRGNGDDQSHKQQVSSTVQHTDDNIIDTF